MYGANIRVAISKQEKKLFGQIRWLLISRSTATNIIKNVLELLNSSKTNFSGMIKCTWWHYNKERKKQVTKELILILLFLDNLFIIVKEALLVDKNMNLYTLSKARCISCRIVMMFYVLCWRWTKESWWS